ncbi:ribbon-helix-helix protein, CopG family [Candidatus Gottesmanbacteria bacterium]|nr:ribbon-helix-helix protein, CopG family [Candidatus Gottesmanbacteria bacterium]
MTTITISLPTNVAKKIDEETKKKGYATRSEFVRNILRKHFYDTEEIEFREFTPKPLEEIRRDFEKSGKYNKKFIDSLIRGLSNSSIYANKTSKS